MYKLIHQDKIIGYSKLESGDAPMGVAFGEFIPNGELEPFTFFSNLPPQGSEFTREIDEADGLLLMGLNDTFKVFSDSDVLIEGQVISIEGIRGDSFQISILGIGYPFYKQEFPKQCKDYETLYGNEERLSIQQCNLNIRYDLPPEIWEKVIEVYEKLPGWLGFGNGEKGDEGIPYWFSYNETEKSISASVEPSGLQIAGVNMTETEWNNWISFTKKLSTSILGFKVGEIELGEVSYDIEWINPPKLDTDDNQEIREEDIPELKKPWWKFW